MMRGQRKHTDADVLEVILDLDDGVPLLPGMRTDVLFREADAAQKTPAPRRTSTVHSQARQAGAMPAPDAGY